MESKRMQEERMRRSYNEWQSWCRLCANKNSSNRDLDPCQEELLRTVEKHFDVILNESNQLPKGLCEECLTFTKFLGEFSNRTFRVQRLYEEILEALQTTQSPILESLRKKYKVNISMTSELGTLWLKDELREGEIKQEDNHEAEDIESEEKNTGADYNHISDESVEVLNDFLEEFIHSGESAEDASTDKGANDPLNDDAESFRKATQKTTNISESEQNLEKMERAQRVKSASNYHSPVSCEICMRTFSSRQYLRKHMELKHDKQAPNIKCSQCNKEFATESQLKLHQHHPTNSKSKTKEHKCEICIQIFSTASLLREHKRVHSDERPFICEKCGFASKTSHALKEHMYSHTEERPIICDVCNKGFKSKDRLKRHQSMHFSTGHTCPKCGQVLKTRYTFSKHLQNHTGERRHKCGFCGRGFKMSKHLKNHLIIHAGIRPYSCIFCDKDFPSSTHVAQHQKVRHREEYLAHIAAGNRHAHLKRDIPSLDQLRALSNSIIQSRESAPVTSNDPATILSESC